MNLSRGRRRNPKRRNANQSKVFLSTADLTPGRSSFFSTALVILLVIAVGAGVFVLLFSNYFRVASITVVGEDNIEQTEVEKVVDAFLAEKSSSPLPNNHIALLDADELVNRLENQFSLLSGVEVEKKLPNLVRVTLKEKVPTILWQQNNTLFELDQTGRIITRPSIDEDLPDLPRVTNIVPVDNGEVGDFVMHPEAIERIITTKNELPGAIGVDASSFQMPTGFAEEFTVETSEGWQIVFDRTRSVESQISGLKKMLNEEIGDKREFLSYVDLRIENVGYFR